MQKKKLSVFIGRMSPFHNGHASDLDLISSSTDHMLILIGSSFRSRSLKNPFTFQERKKMINDYLAANSKCPYDILPLEDNPYNDNEWIASVQKIVRDYRKANCPGYEIEIVASDKEDVTSYPHWFPGFGKRIIPAYRGLNGDIMAATDIRNVYFGQKGFPQEIPLSTTGFLIDFMKTSMYDDLCDEWNFIEEYKESWKTAPYAVNFVTTDAVVVQSGHIALIQRRDNPGKDLWAIPGGFLNINERIVDGCIRELREETGLKVVDKVLKGSIVDREVFDDPKRSDRGRTVTHAFYFKLEDSMDLPHIKGLDDAKKAKWVPISDLYEMRDQFFEDHYFLIKHFLKI